MHPVGLYHSSNGHNSADGTVPSMTLCMLSFHTLRSKAIFLCLEFEHFAYKETPIFELKEAGNYSDFNKTVTLIGRCFISTNITTMARVSQSI